jgi:hypothetical protein
MVILTDSEYNCVYSLMLMKEIVAKSSKSMGMSGGRGIDSIVSLHVNVLGSYREGSIPRVRVYVKPLTPFDLCFHAMMHTIKSSDEWAP